MRRFIAILTLLILPLLTSAQEDQVMQKLDSLADNYTRLIALEPVGMKQQECDFLLSSLSDSAMISHLAVRLYNHYSKSRLMGD